MNEWISVKERLPDKEGDYLVWLDGSFSGGIQQPGGSAGPECPFHYFSTHRRFREDVTHWQPMPAPPKDADAD